MLDVQADCFPPGLGHTELGRLALVYARFEFAVKTSGYAKSNSGQDVGTADCNWEDFTADLDAAGFPEQSRPSLDAARAEFQRAPTKKLMYDPGSRQLLWRPLEQKPTWSDTRMLLECARQVRHNVLHGSKSWPPNEEDRWRDPLLVQFALEVLDCCLQLMPHTQRAFEKEYG